MTARLRVGVNLLFLRPGVVGGSETYLTRLLGGVASLAPADLDLVLFALPSFPHAHPDLAAAFPVVAAPVSGDRRALRVAAERSWLAVEARRRRVAVVHHGGGTAAPLPGVASVLTLHDLQYRTYPETFGPLKLAWLRATVPRSVRRASVVTTPSAYVAGTVVDAFGVDPERVVVVSHGIAPTEATVAPTPLDVVRTRYDLDQPFFVYPAITYPHKNHLVLVRALAELRRRGERAQLVLTGGRATAEVRLAAEIALLGIGDAVRRPGRVPAADLEALYAGAVATLFPSRYEGFGAPVLEAMRRGCPVVAADATALPEVVAGAGALVDAGRPDAWANAMAALLDDHGGATRARWAAAGRARAAELTAERSAAALVDAYRRAVTTGRRARRPGSRP